MGRGLVRRLVPERLATIGADIERGSQPAGVRSRKQIAEREDAIPAALTSRTVKRMSRNIGSRRLMSGKNEFDRFANERRPVESS